MEKKEVWSISDMIAHRNNWSLAADVELLKHLQALSENIFAKASWTLHSLKLFENDVNQTCISIANTSNKFKSLSDTQFIESKVQEESADINQPSNSEIESPADRENENITVKLKEALENGFRVLDTQYDLIPVSGSDSEDDEPQEVLLRARNPYLSRRLPHIVGSEEFTRNDNLGLIDDSSSEDDDEEEDDDDDEYNDTDDNDVEEDKTKVGVESDEESIAIQKLPPLKNEFIRPRTEIIRISSSDSEDSEISIPCSEKQEAVIPENKNKPSETYKYGEPLQNPNSFAEHLNAALKNNTHNIYAVIPPDFGESFYPPPFPGKDNSISSSDDSDVSSNIFTTKKNTRLSVSNTSFKPNYENESDIDNDYDTKTSVISESHNISRESFKSYRKSSIVSRTSQYSNSSSGSSIGNEVLKKGFAVTSDQFDANSLPKREMNESKINSVQRKMVSAINSELSAKLNAKNSIADSVESVTSTTTSESVESRISVVTAEKSSKSSSPVKTVKPVVASNQNIPSNSRKDVKKTALFDQFDDKNSGEEDNVDDLFSAAKKTKSNCEKKKGLFEDDSNIENLFTSVKNTSSSVKETSNFFLCKPTEATKFDKITIESDFKPPIVDLFKKSDLFVSDSDSEDDIFSIIKGKKKLSCDNSKPEPESMFGSVSNDVNRMPISSNGTETTTKTLIFDTNSKPTLSKVRPQSLLTEEKSSNNFDSSTKLADSAKQSINEKNDVMNVTSPSKNSLFEDTKTAGNLFQSDDDDDGLFSKNATSADKRTTTCEHVNVSKSDVPSDIVSFANIMENVNIVKEKSDFRIASTDHSTSSSESVNKTSDEKGNIFAEIQSQKYSSSSENEIEGMINENSLSNIGKIPKNEIEKSTIEDSTEQDVHQNLTSPEKNLFGKCESLSTFGKNSKNKNIAPSQKKDIISESYESRSVVFLPPKDGFSDGFSEDEEIKDNNYLSQEEDDDLLREAIHSDAFFGEKLSINISTKSQKNLMIDASSSENLFHRCPTSSSSTSLFHENYLFREQKHTLEKKYDSGPKTPVSNENKLGSAENAKLLPKMSNDVLDKSKESSVSNFNKNENIDSESHGLSSASEKNRSSVSVTAEVDESKQTERTTPVEKRSRSDEFNSLHDKIEKLNESLQKNYTDKTLSSNPMVGKINTDLFEKIHPEKNLVEDEQDGNILRKSTSSEPVSSSRSLPGKLVAGRGLSINVNALLPGSNWSSKMKLKQGSEPVTSDEKLNVEPVVLNELQNAFHQSTDILINVAKERLKISGKRRPPTRKARKNRMVSDDLFGDGFAEELLSEENKSNAHFDSSELDETAKIETLDTPENNSMSKDVFFGNDDEVNKEDFISKQSDSDCKKSDVSLSESSHSDLNLDTSSSLNRLPCLTKNRAKPQKRSVMSKKVTSDTFSVVSTENSTLPEQMKSKCVAKDVESSDESCVSASFDKQTLSNTNTSVSKSIFDSLENVDNNIFESIKSQKAIEEKSIPEVEVNIETKPTSKPSQTKPKTVENAKINIFNDDDDYDDNQLFISAKKKLSANKLTKKGSLFEDNDDDDLFSSKTSMLSSRKPPDVAVSSAKTKALNEKPRVIKLRSESVQKDPLTGEDLKGPL